MFLFSLSFSDVFKVLFKNSDVEHKYFNSSGLIPFFYLYSHFLNILSLAFTVFVYFLTNWNIMGVCWLFFLKLILNYVFFYWNYFYYFLVHFFKVNSLWSLIKTLVNPLDSISLCCFRTEYVVDDIVLAVLHKFFDPNWRVRAVVATYYFND